TACLFCRRAIDPQLRILPVLLDGITFAELEANERFKDLQIKEVECIISAADSVIDVPAAVLNGLQGLPSTDSRLSMLAAALEVKLARFDGHVLEAAVLLCPEDDLGAWGRRGDSLSKLAIKLLNLDIKSLPKVLGYLAQEAPEFIDELREVSE